MKLGALEAGGTKMVCAVGREDGSILEESSRLSLEPLFFVIISRFHRNVPYRISRYSFQHICCKKNLIINLQFVFIILVSCAFQKSVFTGCQLHRHHVLCSQFCIFVNCSCQA